MRNGRSSCAPRSDVADGARAGGGAMFDGIAARYDLLNRLMSLGADRRWRGESAAALELPRAPARVLDLATGTADLGIRIARTYPLATVVGIDPSARMLALGRKKVAGAGLSARVHLVRGLAEALPLRDRVVDGATMAFGIRNVPDRVQALRETARVVRGEGRVVILELSEPAGWLGRLHVRRIVPWIGGLLSGAREYRYLTQSIASFPSASEFSAEMGRAALRVLLVRPLTLGACHLYVARPVP
jgi:demethylmenaquinone methyltransferase / 2-methoxy-6-polyprenyl-1,4-benzoquinol methylase